MLLEISVIKTRMQLISRGEGEKEYRNIYDAFTFVFALTDQ